MIADALVVRGVAVEHVLGGARRQPHGLTPFAEVVVEEDGDKRLVYPPEGPIPEEGGGRA